MVFLVKNDQGEDLFAKNRFIKSSDTKLKEPGKLTIQFDKESLHDFDQFIDFLDRVAEEADNQVAAVPRDWYNDKQKEALLSMMQNYFNNEILGKDHRFDPPFIVLLQVFLKKYSEEFDGKK